MARSACPACPSPHSFFTVPQPFARCFSCAPLPHVHTVGLHEACSDSCGLYIPRRGQDKRVPEVRDTSSSPFRGPGSCCAPPSPSEVTLGETGVCTHWNPLPSGFHPEGERPRSPPVLPKFRPTWDVLGICEDLARLPKSPVFNLLLSYVLATILKAVHGH